MTLAYSPCSLTPPVDYELANIVRILMGYQLTQAVTFTWKSTDISELQHTARMLAVYALHMPSPTYTQDSLQPVG